MKTIITLLSLCLPFLSMTQDTALSYSKIVEAPNITKDELFVRARQWLNETFESSKDVLQIADKETGELSGKGFGYIKVSYKMMGTRSYESLCKLFINIYLKDGKYKYIFSNFQTDVASSTKGHLSLLTSTEVCPDRWDMVSQKKMNEIWKSAKEGAMKMAMDLGNSLELAMVKKTPSDF